MALNFRPPTAPPVRFIVAAVGAVGVVALLVFLGFQMQQLKLRIVQSDQQIRELEARNQDLTQRLEGLQADRKQLDSRVANLGKQLAEASSELEQARAGFQELQTRYARLSDERSALHLQVTALTDEREVHQHKLEELAGEKRELEHSVVRLRERLSFLDRDYQRIAAKMQELEQASNAAPVNPVTVMGRDLKEEIPVPPAIANAIAAPATQPRETVELPPIIVRKDQAGTSLPVRGQLVEINEPHHFIVVDKGSTDGVRLGMSFDIVRGAGMVVGQATAVRVRPQLTACDIVRASTSERVQVGDTVVQRTP